MNTSCQRRIVSAVSRKQPKTCSVLGRALEANSRGQSRWAQEAYGQWLTVLGAGRLLDLNSIDLLPRFQKLRLVDADPLCLAAWKNLPKPVDPVFTDISLCLDGWLRALRQVREPWPATLDIIRKHRAPVGYLAFGSDALLSLNILNQLQIVWQDAVETLLKQRFASASVTRHETSG
jgi:hypothetical protein